MFKRIYVEKKKGFDVKAHILAGELMQQLNLENLELRLLNRYDIVSDIDVSDIIWGIFAEINQDEVFYELSCSEDEDVFGIEYQPGQYDMRCDSAEQCVRLIKPGCSIKVNHASVYILKGLNHSADVDRIIKYLVNPVDSRLADLGEYKPNEFAVKSLEPYVLCGFTAYDDKKLKDFIVDNALAMDLNDIKLIRDYFRDEEKRDPTDTEIKVLDTYWSDHCRHTTFMTKLENISFAKGAMNDEIKKSYEEYLGIKNKLGRHEKNTTLMDIATIASKYHSSIGLNSDVEISDEVNACSYEVMADNAGKNEPYLIMFKNETHNHPTEIEPFGGAATCLGGAIRDPLSGRAYVYQSMRVTGCGDPFTPLDKTLPGKLSQRRITTEAANGFSSYGNQIGLCTGQVKEYYHPDFAAKRMEVGAVIAAAAKKNVKRLKPQKGDIVYVIGGRTGRDGIGGASGSSKEHTEKSVATAGSEVQKGNAVEERKLQRLIRKSECARLIKKCNDFGAGGVSVAIGELADSLEIYLDSLLLKYEGLTPTEIAISESQERMAVIITPDDEEEFLSYVKDENIEYSKSAVVTDSKRLVMKYNGKTVLSIKRSFIDTNGAPKSACVKVDQCTKALSAQNYSSLRQLLLEEGLSLNNASQQGLIEMFDNTIGSLNLIMPFGGKYALTPSDVMAARIPVESGVTKTASVMAHGYDPCLGKDNPYLSGIYSVVACAAKLACAGCSLENIKLSMQEYFGKLRDDPQRWAKPFEALIGALKAQLHLKLSAIGGKDSMSGSFENLDVPPSIICFGVACINEDDLISNEFKSAGSAVAVLRAVRDENGVIDLESFADNLAILNKLIKDKRVLSAKALDRYGIAEGISKMCFGNRLGFEFLSGTNINDISKFACGDIIIELKDDELPDLEIIGHTLSNAVIALDKETTSLDEIIKKRNSMLAEIFPIVAENSAHVHEVRFENLKKTTAQTKYARPRVFVPVFPGTNCEYDTIRAFESAGAKAESMVFKNLSAEDISESVRTMKNLIASCQIVALPGGFSAGDEPDGSGKFIVSVLNNPYIAEEIEKLLYIRDGLMIGICNGFQALVKTGLLPYGRMGKLNTDSPTLTFNTIGRHVAKIAKTKITSNLSPWLYQAELGKVYNVALSHGEGRFVADEKTLKLLEENGQIAAQYCGINAQVSADADVNPNGSMMNIEAITSADGRILGKMGHSERWVEGLYKNIPGEFDQKIFVSGVKYYS